MYQNLCNTPKALLRGIYNIDIYVKKKERFQIDNLILYLKGLEEEQTKPKFCTMKEIKIMAEINEIETRKPLEKINKTKSCFLLKNKRN